MTYKLPISKTYGYTDDVIQITGKNFGTDKNAIVVKINDVVTPIINSAISGFSFSVKVPAKCGTGKITATRAGKTATAPRFYYIPSVTVTTLYGKRDQASFTNGIGTDMRMNNPSDFVFDKKGNIYVVERGGALGGTAGSLIMKISGSTGKSSTFSGGDLSGNTANVNVNWTNGLPASGDVNGGEARFNLPTGICISEDPGSDAFKLFVTQNNFIRIINEYTATGVFAGNLKDSTGGGGPPIEGGRHDAHIFPSGEIVAYPNGTDYGSPSLFFIGQGRLAKQDVNGNIQTLVKLTNYAAGGFLATHPDGNIYMQSSTGSGVKKIYKITKSGNITTWINDTDSLLNQATGKKERFYDIEVANITSFATDKDGNMFLTTYNSSNTDLYKIMPDKSFIRLFDWYHKSNYPQIDGINDNAGMLEPKSMLVRDNGDIYFIDGMSIRKMSFE